MISVSKIFFAEFLRSSLLFYSLRPDFWESKKGPFQKGITSYYGNFAFHIDVNCSFESWYYKAQRWCYAANTTNALVQNMATHLWHFKIFKGCLPHILLGPFLNSLAHLFQHFSRYFLQKEDLVQCPMISTLLCTVD